jgi:ABC-type glycerol-3-phosphate transport system substrate-binding protein
MKSSTFQTIIIIVFVIAFLGAVVAFSGLLSSGDSATDSGKLSGSVTIWGTLPSDGIQQYINDINSEGNGYTINYEEHPAASFYQELIVAIADGAQPDVVVVPNEIFSQFSDKLYTIPFAAYNERAFRDTNVDGAQVFLASDGVKMLPLMVDPLVVYYNKDILAQKSLLVPPLNWTALAQTVPFFTKRDAKGAITQAGIALGATDNVTHFRDIMSALFLQTGNTIVARDTSTGLSQVMLATAPAQAAGESGNVTLPTADAVRFYTGFSNAVNRNYSWNRSLPTDKEYFLAGKLAFYIGRASELFTIQAQNPNFNFDVSPFFQAENASRPIVYGSFIGAGILKSAPNFPAAYDAASKFATVESIDALSKKFSIPPVRRDLLLVSQQNPYLSVFFRAATNAFSWPDPNPEKTNTIFRDMIQSVTSGATDADGAIYEATRNLQSSIR